MSAKNKSGTLNKQYQHYPAYKDSGVEWLGEIPEHWKILRLKTISNVRLSNVDKIPKAKKLYIYATILMFITMKKFQED